MRVLVAGSTGYLGRHVVREMKARGHWVRALARDPDRLDGVREAIDDMFVAEATDRGALAGCCDDIDVVFSAIGVVNPKSRATVWEVDYGANRNLLDEARGAGARKFIYTSVLQPPGMGNLRMVRAKRAFESDLERSGMDHAVLYPTGFFSDMEEFLAMARRGRVFVFGTGGFRINPVDGADVAAAAADAISADARRIEVGGPEVMTHERIAEEAFHAVRGPVRITHIPAWIPKAARGLLRRFTPLRVYGPLEFLLTVLTCDVVAPTTGRRRLADHFREVSARHSRDAPELGG